MPRDLPLIPSRLHRRTEHNRRDDHPAIVTDSSGNGANDTEHQSGLSDDDGPARSRMLYGEAEHGTVVDGKRGAESGEAQWWSTRAHTERT
jgi:hypothetical protein